MRWLGRHCQRVKRVKRMLEWHSVLPSPILLINSAEEEFFQAAAPIARVSCVSH